jgi:hypothetical protein
MPERWAGVARHARPMPLRMSGFAAAVLGSAGATNISPGVEAYMPGPDSYDPSSQSAWAGNAALSTED